MPAVVSTWTSRASLTYLGVLAWRAESLGFLPRRQGVAPEDAWLISLEGNAAGADDA
jgi:hypothetical protein